MARKGFQLNRRWVKSWLFPFFFQHLSFTTLTTSTGIHFHPNKSSIILQLYQIWFCGCDISEYKPPIPTAHTLRICFSPLKLERNPLPLFHGNPLAGAQQAFMHLSAATVADCFFKIYIPRLGALPDHSTCIYAAITTSRTWSTSPGFNPIDTINITLWVFLNTFISHI